MSSDNVTISDWIANAIADSGCTTVYGGHGGALVPMVNAVCAHPKLTWVYARNEHDAAEMAAAHAKMTGGLGVVIATSGPGATNLVTGLMEALLDESPLLAITGLKPTAQLGYAEFQDVDQSRLFAGAGIEWSKNAASVSGVIPLIRDAVSTALFKRTCTHIAIPVDIQAAPSPLPIKRFCAMEAYVHMKDQYHRQKLDEGILNDTAQTLVGRAGECKPKNIICVGLRACFEENMGDAIIKLAEALNAPVLTRLHAKGVIDESHPLAFGVVGVHGKPGLETAAMLISSSDCVISIGVSDQTLIAANMAGLQVRHIIEIEPDSRGLSTRFVSEHAIIGNMHEACVKLAEKCEFLNFKREKEENISSYRHDRKGLKFEVHENLSTEGKFHYMRHQSIRFARGFDVAKLEDRRVSEAISEVSIDDSVDVTQLDSLSHNTEFLWNAFHKGKWRTIDRIHSRLRYQCDYTKTAANHCHPAALLEKLSLLRREDTTNEVFKNATINVDVGDVTLWASLCLSLSGGSRTLYSERLGTMGYALCSGIASILARPAPAGAVVLAGDGGFQMTLQELSTFQQLKRPGDKLLCIVFDNQTLGRVAFGFNDAKGCETLGPDYVMLSKAYGGDAILLNSNENIGDALEKAMAADGLFVIHVIMDPDLKADMVAFHDSSLEVMNSG